MLKNYLKVALRNLIRHRLYTLVNLFGLALGMTAAILLYLYVSDELSYDKYHPESSSIYRVLYEGNFAEGGQTFSTAATPELMAATLKTEFPEVTDGLRIFKGSEKKPLTYEKKRIYANGMLYADANFFEFFSCEFIQGNPKTALQKPNSMVITRTLAEQLFGGIREAVGKTVLLFDYQQNEITAVIENLPSNTHLKFPALVSLSTIADKFDYRSWHTANFYTYIKLRVGSNPIALNEAINQTLQQKYINPKLQAQAKVSTDLQALEDIHLSNRPLENNDVFDIGEVAYVYIFSIIALFILAIASINYMNLATARSALRAREVGIRKVVGAHRWQLIAQFLAESVLMAFFALILSLCLVELSLPYFNYIADKSLYMPYAESWYLLPVLLIITLSVGLLSGSYPALFLSQFKPAMVIKGKFARSKGNRNLRKALVVFQFAVSISLIIGTWIVYDQLSYLRQKYLGFNQDNIAVVEVFNTELSKKREAISKALLGSPYIKQVANSSVVPGDKNSISREVAKLEKDGKMHEQLLNTMQVDSDFISLMDMKLVAGRNFKDKHQDSLAVIINQTLAQKMGWVKDNHFEEALGKEVQIWFDTLGNVKYSHKVVGVVQDFHLSTLHDPIEPLVMSNYGRYSSNMLIRFDPRHTQEALAHSRKVWEEFDERYAFDAYFLDENFAREYEADSKKGLIFMAFSTLTILIACLGLFGLASFTAEQRSKEIGIRKVLGASVPSILTLVSSEFLGLVLAANFIAFPVAYIAMSSWLQDFAYRTEINFLVFVLAALLALIIALITISSQALRAASINPANILKNE